jgi:leucyl-tRNA synthetase
VKAVGEEIERLGFNKAIARIYELANTLQAPLVGLATGAATPELKAALRQALEFMVVMIGPMMPHLAEECWAAFGGNGFVADQPWPKFEPALTVDSEITLPVQVNGKKRGDLTISRDADQLTVEQAALALDFVQKALEGKPPRKVIVVPQRIVNVVA